MPIPVVCTGCRTALHAPDEGAGKRVKCPKCKTVVLVPAAEPVNAFAGFEVEEPQPKPVRRQKPAKDKPTSRTKLYLGIAAGVVLVIGGVIAAVVAGGGKPTETAKNDPPPKGATAPVTPAPKKTPPIEPPPIPPAPIPEPPLPEPEPMPEPPPATPMRRGDDVFAKAAGFKADGPLVELPALPPAAKRPLLVLDPGGHSAFVKNVHFTPNADRVITVGEDKTVRIWDMASGEPLSIHRLPAGQSFAGKLWASALTSDGKRLAVAGYPIEEGKDGVPIYILSTETGRLEKVIKGATDAVFSLDFSPDDSLLAAGCTDGSLHCFEVATSASLFRVFHPSTVSKVKFHPKKKLLASLGAEKAVGIWNYATKSKPVIKEMPQQGPNDIAWSSDGSTLAVGCTNGEIHLLSPSGEQQKVLPKAEERNAPIQVVRLRFLPGDKELVFGGIAFKGWAGVVDAETGKRRVMFTGHTNTVMAVSCSQDGRLAVSSGGELNETCVWSTADGTLARVFAGGGRSMWGIGWAKDGRSIAWGNTNRHNGDGFPLEHSLDLDAWQRGGRPNAADYQRHIHDDGTFSIEIDGFFKFTVKEKGKPLYTHESKKGNRIYSVSILPNKGVLVGASGTMNLLDLRSGKVLRNYEGDTGLTISLAPSPDGRHFISGSSDQTIRIWNPDREEAVLSIFVAGREWIAWTPQGYYSCSAYGERLIAWQVNNGNAKLPSIHAAVRFRPSLYQPELIKYLIPAGDLKLALAMAEKFERRKIAITSVMDVLPPDVSITAPTGAEVTTANESITIRGAAVAAGKHPVAAMRLIVDGRPFQGAAGVKRIAPGAKAEAEWTVPLSPGVHSLAVLAESAVSKNLSQPLVVTRTGNEPPPNLYVLAVGVSDYPGDMKLNFAASDAKLLKQAFSESCKGVFGKIEVKILTDKDATKKGIIEGLDWLASKMTAKDVGVFSFSGHGTRDPNGKFHLVPVDVKEDDPDGTCLSGDLFKSKLENMPGRLVAILDACHSGAVAEAKGAAEEGKVDGLVRDLLTDDYGVVVMCASLGREFALESPTTKAGFFTLGLVEGLAGKADTNKDGLIFINELDVYAGLRVNQLSGGRQNPVTGRPPTIRPFAMAKP